MLTLEECIYIGVRIELELELLCNISKWVVCVALVIQHRISHLCSKRHHAGLICPLQLLDLFILNERLTS